MTLKIPITTSRHFFIFVAFFLLGNDLFPRQAAAILRRPITAKANALGLTYSGSVKDPSALLWNPAGLAHISGHSKLVNKDKVKEAEEAFQDSENKNFGEWEEKVPNVTSGKGTEEYRQTFEFQLLSSVSQLTLDQRIGFIGVGFPVFVGSLGFGVLGSQVQGIDGFDANGVSTGELEYNLYAAYAGYAFEKDSTLLGIGLNGIVENLAGRSVFGGGIDLGIQFFASVFELGAVLQNLLGLIQRSDSEPTKFDRLDIMLRLSASFAIPRTGIRLYLGLTSNLDDHTNNPPVLNAGFSYDIFRYVSILLGLNGSKPSIGLELKFPYVGVSYALNRDELGLGIQHYVDLNLRF